MLNMLRKQDFVVRISYNRDVIFVITDIVRRKDNNIYILKGITKRIVADSFLDDLEKIDKKEVIRINRKEEEKTFARSQFKIENKKYYTGKILHLDGDRRYSEKSLKYYRNLGLNAVVKNIPENKQAKLVISLLNKYEPDILIITGHDGMIKKGTNYNDIYNYRNSRHFINTVNTARMWKNPKSRQLAIFAGACQSYYEAIMMAGANFASSPKRIMIDFVDPLVVAKKIAMTENTKYLTINDIESELRDGRNGIDGVGTMGKKIIKKGM